MLGMPRLSTSTFAGSCLFAGHGARRIGGRRLRRVRRILPELGFQLGDSGLQLGVLGLEPVEPGQQRFVVRIDLTIQILWISMSTISRSR
jgi:hypothetical protein